jgi:hypothetical protein
MIKNFKPWFKNMWSNRYIQIFTVAFIIFIWQLFNIETNIEVISEGFSEGVGPSIMSVIAVLLPILACTVTATLGFYKHWQTIK